jgi:hypothetical protein
VTRTLGHPERHRPTRRVETPSRQDVATTVASVRWRSWFCSSQDDLTLGVWLFRLRCASTSTWRIGSLRWSSRRRRRAARAVLGWNRGNYGVSIGVEGSPFEIDFRFPLCTGRTVACQRTGCTWTSKPLNRSQQAELDRLLALGARQVDVGPGGPELVRPGRSRGQRVLPVASLMLHVGSFLACDLVASRPTALACVDGLAGRCKPSALIRVRPAALTGSSGLILAMP